jgi:ComF family protein
LAFSQHQLSLFEMLLAALQSIFTHTCHFCVKRIPIATEIFCLECYGNLPKTSFRFSEDNPVVDRFKGLLSIYKAGAWLYYNQNDMIRDMLYEIKYRQNRELAVHLGRLCAQDFKEDLVGIDLIIPIPLHPSKESIRGFNQTKQIGIGLSEGTDIKMLSNNLNRIVFTDSQTKKTRDERFQNVSQVFELKDKSKIEGKNILLLDDVITTGATLESAANEVLKANPNTINILTLATAFEL